MKIHKLEQRNINEEAGRRARRERRPRSGASVPTRDPEPGSTPLSLGLSRSCPGPASPVGTSSTSLRSRTPCLRASSHTRTWVCTHVHPSHTRTHSTCAHIYTRTHNLYVHVTYIAHMQCIYSCTCVHTHNAISHPCTQHARTRANMQVTRNTLMHDTHVMHMRIPHTTQHTREHTIHTSTRVHVPQKVAPRQGCAIYPPGTLEE